MDLSENGKCLFTSLQYVESSHAPYQRIRFFTLCVVLWYVIEKMERKTYYRTDLGDAVFQNKEELMSTE
jgi:hypothetical protein